MSQFDVCLLKTDYVGLQLKKLKADIICLQETHIKLGHEHLLKDKNLGTDFAVAAKVKKRGLVTYFKNPNIKVSVLGEDAEARFQIFKVKFPNQISWTLANIYAPNNGKAIFYKKIFLLPLLI